MLKTKAVLSINGESKIEDENVVYMTATINSDETGTSISKTIINKELYNANKDDVRKEMNEFENYVYNMEGVLTETTSAIEE